MARWGVRCWLLVLLGATAFAAPAVKIFKAMEARPVTDWRTYGASAYLNEALQAYEKAPSMTTALGVLQHFPELAENDAMRTEMLTQHAEMFLSIDIAKYEMVLHTVEALGRDVSSAVRTGSSAPWFFELEKWVRLGRRGPPPKMDPAKQFKSDDDITVVLRMERFLNAKPEVVLDNVEKLNGDFAAEVYHQIALTQFGVDLHPDKLKTNFLSPTAAEQIMVRTRGRTGLDRFAWNLSNEEKYNSLLAVEFLELRAYEAGVAIDVNYAGDTFRYGVRAMGDPKKLPPQLSELNLLGFIADNYRQIDLHGGELFYKCKYLARLVHTWRKALGGGSLNPAWIAVAERANAVYINAAADPKQLPNSEALLADVNRTLKELILGMSEKTLLGLTESVESALKRSAARRIEANLRALSEGRRGDVKWQPMTLEELKSAPAEGNELSITQWQEMLAVAHADVGPDRFNEIVKQAIAKLESSPGAGQQTLLRSTIIADALGEAKQAATRTVATAERYKLLRARLESSLPSVIAHADAHGLINRIFDAESKRSVHRLENGDVRPVVVDIDTPGGAVHEARLAEAAAEAGGYPEGERKMARTLRELAEAAAADNKSAELNKWIREFRDLHKTANAPKREATVIGPDGKPAKQTWTASGIAWGSWMLKTLLKGGELYGKAQGGKAVYDSFTTWMGGNAVTPEEQGQLFFGMLFGTLAAKDLPQSYVQWRTGREVTRGSPLALAQEIVTGGNVALMDFDPAANNAIAYAALQDLGCWYLPEACPAFLLLDIAKWGYKTYTIAAEKSNLVNLLLQRGVWKPAAFKDLATLKPGQLPEITAIRLQGRGSTGAPVDLLELAKLATYEGAQIPRLALLTDGTEFDPRKELQNLGYDTDQMLTDPVFAASVDAIRTGYAKTSWQGIWRGYLKDDPKNWTQPVVQAMGIKIARREDDTSPLANLKVELPAMPKEVVRAGGRNVVTPPAGVRGMRDEAKRTLAWLIADFWRKQQQLLEGPVLDAVKEAAAREWLKKLTADGLAGAKYELISKAIADIDTEVAAIDKKLWPRIAVAARPFPGPAYDPVKNTPILDTFRESTAAQRKVLAALEASLKDSAETNFVIVLDYSGRGGVGTVDRAAAEKYVNESITSMRETAKNIGDNYTLVHGRLDQVKAMVVSANPAGLNACFEPWHLGLLSKGGTAWSLNRWNGNPDASRAASWADRYRTRDEEVAGALIGKSRIEPGTALVYNTGDYTGLASHPLWNKLRFLRYEIQRLEDAKEFADVLTPADLNCFWTRITVKDKEPPKARTIDGVIEELEAEFRRLTTGSADVYQISLAPSGPAGDTFIQQRKPFAAAIDPKQRSAYDSFRWFIRRCDEEQYESTADTKESTVQMVFRRAGDYCVKVNGLGRGDLTIAQSKDFKLTVKPISFTGEVLLAGDYDGSPIELYTLGEWDPDPVPPSIFREYSLLEKEPIITDSRARVQVAGVTYTSNTSKTEWLPDRGTIRILTPLKITIPYKVTVKVEVKDLAGKEVKGSQISLFSGTQKVDAPSGTAELWLLATNGLRATISYPAFGLEVQAGSAVGTLESRAITLSAKLDMFEAGSFKLSGNVVPAIATQRAVWVQGEVESNLGRAPIVNGRYELTNKDPIVPTASVTLRAFLKDDKGKNWQSMGPAEVGRVPTMTPVQAPDLKVATTTSISIRLTDWAGKPLPARAGTVKRRDGEDWPAVDSLYIGEYLFSKPDEKIVLDARAAGSIQGQLEITAAQAATNPMPVQDLRLRAYWPGSIRVRGVVSAATPPNGFPPPQSAALSVRGTGAGGVNVGNRYDISPAVLILPGEVLRVEANANSGNLRFSAAANLTAPLTPPAASPLYLDANLPMALLNPEAADPCPGLQNQARDAMNRNDIQRARDLAAQLQARNCYAGDVTGYLTGVDNAGRINGLLPQAGAAVQDCDFRRAKQIAEEILRVNPNNAWAAGAIGQLTALATAQSRVDALLGQLQGALSTPPLARRYANDARQAAGGQQCLISRVDQAEAQIPKQSSTSDILSAATNTTGTLPPEQPPVVNPPNPPVRNPGGGKCTMDASSNIRRAAAGTPVTIRAALASYGDVSGAKLFTRGGCEGGCPMRGRGPGVYVYETRFVGRDNDIDIRLAAHDANGQELCQGFLTLHSDGVKP